MIDNEEKPASGLATQPAKNGYPVKTFELHRDTDETGISGTGHVADGIVFDDGHAALRWRTPTRCPARVVGARMARRARAA